MTDLITDWINRIGKVHLAGDYAIAESLAHQAIKETGNAPKILEIAGIIAFNQQRYDEAIEFIERAMFETPLSFTSQLVLAKSFVQLNQDDRAKATTQFLTEMVDQLPCEMLPDLSQLTAHLDQYDLALAVCSEATTRHPSDDNAFFGAAIYMQRLGYPNREVKDVMQEALALATDSDVYRLNMAAICFSLSQKAEAYEHAQHLSEKALETLPCGCIGSMLKKIFEEFRDDIRLGILTAQPPNNTQETKNDGNA